MPYIIEYIKLPWVLLYGILFAHIRESGPTRKGDIANANELSVDLSPRTLAHTPLAL